MGGGDELDAALGDGAGGLGFELAADLVDDDDLGHVVLDGLDHHLVLQRGRGDLHAAGASNAVVGDVAVTGDLVGGVDDDDAAVVLVGEDAGDLAEHRGLADAGASQQEDAAAGLGEVVDDLDGAEDGPSDARGEADDFALAVADGGDAVEGALDAGAVILAEVADALGDELEVVGGDVAALDHHLAVEETGGGGTAEVEDDFEQLVEVVLGAQGQGHPRRQHREELLQLGGVGARFRVGGQGGHAPTAMSPGCETSAVIRFT